MMSIGSLRRYAALAPGAMVAAMLAMVTTGATAARSPATASPNPSATANSLSSVSAVSGGDAWAAGWYNKTFSIEDPLIVHWNGTTWTRVPSSHPNSALINLSGVSEVSGSDVWAVGDYFTNRTNPLIMHWNGTTWTRSPSPHPSSTHNVLSRPSALSDRD